MKLLALLILAAVFALAACDNGGPAGSPSSRAPEATEESPAVTPPSDQESVALSDGAADRQPGDTGGSDQSGGAQAAPPPAPAPADAADPMPASAVEPQPSDSSAEGAAAAAAGTAPTSPTPDPDAPADGAPASGGTDAPLVLLRTPREVRVGEPAAIIVTRTDPNIDLVTLTFAHSTASAIPVDVAFPANTVQIEVAVTAPGDWEIYAAAAGREADFHGAFVAVATASDPHAAAQIRVVDSSTNETVREWLARDGNVAWLPDSGELLFVRRYQGGEQLVAGDPASGDIRVLRELRIDAVLGSPAPERYSLSPDGRTIVTARAGGSVFLVDAYSATAATVSPTPQYPGMTRWSPDGRFFLLDGNDLSIHTAEGDFLHVLQHTSERHVTWLDAGGGVFDVHGGDHRFVYLFDPARAEMVISSIAAEGRGGIAHIGGVAAQTDGSIAFAWAPADGMERISLLEASAVLSLDTPALVAIDNGSVEAIGWIDDGRQLVLITRPPDASGMDVSLIDTGTGERAHILRFDVPDQAWVVGLDIGGDRAEIALRNPSEGPDTRAVIDLRVGSAECGTALGLASCDPVGAITVHHASPDGRLVAQVTEQP